MNNKQYLYSIAVLFIIGLIIFIISLLQTSSFLQSVANFCFGIMGILSTLFVLRTGTFRKTIFFNITMALFCITTIGILFKISHWVGANIILSIGLLGVIINYTLRFFTKPVKLYPDYLKLLFVTTLFARAWCMIMHYPYAIIEFVPDIIMLILLAYYVYNNYRNKEWLNA